LGISLDVDLVSLVVASCTRIVVRLDPEYLRRTHRVVARRSGAARARNHARSQERFYAPIMALSAARDAIVGAWRLFDYGDRESESDSWTPTFGEGPAGVVISLRNGLVTAQVAAAVNDHTATVDYVGYFGTYFVREARQDGDEIVGIVEHHMESAYPPQLLEEDADRPFRITADQLTLGDGLTSKRLLRRIP
jgi:hypothetical protein